MGGEVCLPRLKRGSIAGIFFVFAVLTLWANGAAGQTSGWVWLGGSDTVNGSLVGTYGTQGTAATTNVPGGRTNAISWTDSHGDFWLFGGLGYDSTGNYGYLNDLWKYSTTTLRWTWISGSNSVPEFLGVTGSYGTLGSFSATNNPGGRQVATSWVDTSGNLWLFGGNGYDSTGTLGFLNDLWEFDIAKRQWRWMGGSNIVTSSSNENGQPGVYGTLGVASAANIPGGRQGGASWVDASGNFWLFGGEAYDANDVQVQGLNDLWKYNPASQEWTWMAGSSALSFTCGCAPAVYGSLGIGAPQNTPGGRLWAVAWTDHNGNLWLFGGEGIDSANRSGGLNDLWRFSQSTNEWAWMGGVSTLPGPGKGGVLGVFGTEGVPSASNMPGSRDSAVAWVGQDGHFWLMGGGLFGNYGAIGRGSDLWEFDPASSQWTWWGGDGTVGNEPGVYGTLGILAANNLSGGRIGANAWADGIGNLWLFGGTAIDSAGNVGALNDLWRYQPVGVIEPAAIPVFTPPAGTYASVQSVVITDATAGALIYYTIDGTTPTASSNLYSSALTVSSTETVRAIAVATGYGASPVASAAYTINLPAAAIPTFNVAAGSYTSVQTVTISDATPNATIYYTTDGSTPTASSSVYSGPISVATSETIKAIATAGGYSTSAVASATYTINLPPPSFTFAASPTSLIVTSGGKGTTTLTISPQNGFNSAVSFACSGLPAGATCAFSPTTVTPSGSAATTTLTVAAPAKSAMARPAMCPLSPETVLALAVGLFGWRRRRTVLHLLVIVTAFGALGLIVGCGGGGGGSSSGGGSTPITSTVTVTATSGSLQQTANFTLTVN